MKKSLERRKAVSKGVNKPGSQGRKLEKAPVLLDFGDPALVRAKLRGFDSVEEARAVLEIEDFASDYWQIDDEV